MRNRIVMVCAVLFCLVLVASGGYVVNSRAEQPMPALSEVQKLQVQNAVQRVELAQLRYVNAASEFEKARGDANALLKSLEREGFVLNLQTMQYEKKPSEKTNGR